MCAARRLIPDLLPAHTIPSTNGKRLKRLLVILIETLLVSRIGVGQESFGMENARLHPVVEIILDVLQIHADDVLARRLAVVLSFFECGLKVDARERMHRPLQESSGHQSFGLRAG